MPSLSPAVLKRRESSARESDSKTPLLDARRLSELTGFLLCVLGLLALLSLLSYHPFDPSLDTVPAAGEPTNWIGVWGSYAADALFQSLGWVAYLVPVTFFVTGARLLLLLPIQAPWSKGVGTVLLMGSLAGLLELFPHTPAVGGLERGAIRGSGLVGYLVAIALLDGFNRVGATIVAGALFLSSLFLVTRFSFSAAFEFLKARASFLKPIGMRFKVWREARERERLRRALERTRAEGKRPVVIQKLGKRFLAPACSPGLDARQTGDPEEFEESLQDDVHEPEITLPLKPVPVVRGRGLEPEQMIGAGTSAVLRRPATPRIASPGPVTFKLPSSTLLRQPEDQQGINEQELKERAARLTEKFGEFGVTGSVTQIHPGPVVTTFEFKPEAGIKYSRITSLVDDLCLAMKAESILIERIAGKSTVGIEVPNLHREIIHLRELVEAHEFATSSSRLTLCLGKDITGKMKVTDLAQMPHLLIAGSTGSGKSVAINSMIVSILYKATPNEVKMIMIDPKRLELNLYDGIPHLFTPIVTEPKVAANVLRRATFEMEERLKKLAEHGVRNIEQYNKLFEPDSTLNLFDESGKKESEKEGPLPYLVIVIDELADLMMVEPQNVEESITRLAQMARAVGIHLILATQRPSVDVITGLIKANLPSRISFRVASKVDSRTILDANGAEALLGRGDMLFMPPASARLVRMHGPLVTEKEINKVVEWWKSQSAPEYNEEFLKPFRDKDGRDKDGRDKDSRDGETAEDEEDAEELDEVYDAAVRIVVESGKASTSLLQRRLRLGYGRAARLLDLMQKDGIISSPDGSKPREVLKRPEWLEEVDESLR
jgi:DNA segregation ATPase FtsK/SpoIIIE, S-DNA-T family